MCLWECVGCSYRLTKIVGIMIVPTQPPLSLEAAASYDGRMALEAAAQLLVSALMLLQLVSANPSLPQSVRDGVQAFTQNTITEATRAIAKTNTGAAPLWCTITSDKPNYMLGEIIVFSWTTNAAAARFVPDMSGNGNLAVPAIELVPAGVWRTTASVRGYPFATIEVKDANGARAACSSMVYVY